MSVNSIKLNNAQREAVEFKDGICFVLSGAGSGKSKAIVARVINLINKHNIRPENILVFTFTRKAALELVDRLEKPLGPINIDALNIGTMHSIFLKILKQEGEEYLNGIWPFELLTKDWERKKLIEQVMLSTKVPSEYFEPWECLRRIGLIKNLDNEYYEDCPDWLQKIYKEYEKLLHKKKLMEFDSILTYTRDLFKKHKNVLIKYQNRFKYILVDEYQDTNPLQSEIIQMLVEGNNNLFAVGDVEQSIYGFRGTRPEIMLNYKKMYPNAELIRMDINYRSGVNIVDKANKLISVNKNPLTIELVTDLVGGEVYRFGNLESADAEADRIASKIQHYLSVENRQPREIAILYRTNNQSRALEDHMVRNQIPYRIVGSESFYHRAEIQDMLSYLQIVEHPERCMDAICRIYCRPNRFLGFVWLDQYKQKAIDIDHIEALNENYSRPQMTQGASKLYEELIYLVNQKKDNPDIKPDELLNKIRYKVGYDKWLTQQSMAQEDNDRIENLNEFTITAGRFASVEKLFHFIEILKQKARENAETENKVSLLTIHKAKGLEWPIVFVAGMVQGLLPHHKGNLNEERRVAYVAITRAQEKLYLSDYQIINNKPCKPSEFLTDMGLIERKLESKEENEVKSHKL